MPEAQPLAGRLIRNSATAGSSHPRRTPHGFAVAKWKHRDKVRFIAKFRPHRHVGAHELHAKGMNGACRLFVPPGWQFKTRACRL